MQTSQNNNLIISIPTATKTLIDAEFRKDYSQSNIDKIYALVYKINKENNNYQINLNNHTWFFGFKNRGETSKILSRLRKNFIIDIVTYYTKGKESNAYKLIKPYDYKNESCYRINYYEGQVKYPIWVQKYICDGGIVKNKQTTNWIKDVSTFDSAKTKRTLSRESILEAEIKRLKTLLEANGIDCSDVNLEGSNELKITKDKNTVDHVAKQHEVSIKPKGLPFKPKDKVEVPDTFTYTQDEVDYKINNYQKLVTISDSDLQLSLALKKIVNLSTSKGFIVTNNKQVSVQKEIKENYINIYVN